MIVAPCMRSPRQPVRVFVSSPSDVKEERRIAKEVLFDLNRLVGPQLGITLEPLLWEDAVPDMGSPQAAINRQFPDCEVFIGIVWARFGSPTVEYGSGTEEEFSIAYARWRENGIPRILLYVCSRDIPYPNDEATASQLLRRADCTKILRLPVSTRGTVCLLMAASQATVLRSVVMLRWALEAGTRTS